MMFAVRCPPASQKTRTLGKLRAARRLLTRGWCQGSYSRSGLFAARAYCAYGAIDHVCGPDTRTRDEAITALEEMLGRRSLIGWNDTFDRTETEVISLFDQTIEAEA